MVEPKQKYVIGIDTGGTFTDSVIVDEDGNIFQGKALTNYQDFKQGVIDSLENAVAKTSLTTEEILRDTVLFGHGTTLGTNAVIDRKFGKAGLLTTKGHEDTTIIMRGGGGRTDGLNEEQIRHQVTCRKPEPLIPHDLIKGVEERIDCFGETVIPLNKEQARQAIDALVAEGVEAIAICLFWSFVNPQHEKELKQMIEESYPDLYISVSHEVAPQIREYARSMTVVIDACIGKLMKDYIGSLNEELMGKGLTHPISIMHAYGGMTSSATALPVSTIESGPVGGVIGCKYFANLLGIKNVITTDVGGTSFDVSTLWNEEWSFRKEPIMMRFRVAVPIINISCIGAAGGSIARIDPITEELKVGPSSVGSSPGPVCYDLGGEELTVTDADLILGYLNPDYFFEGTMTLNKDKALKLMEEKIAKPLNMDVVHAAAGIYDIVNSFMTDNLRLSVIEKGLDPRDFSIFSYGGNGPMHVGSYIADLGVDKAYVFPQSSVFSALGIALADISHVYKKTEFHQMPADPDKVTATFMAMEEKAAADMEKEGFKTEEITFHRELDMKYGRQVHEVSVPVKGGQLTLEDLKQISDKWEKTYEAIYGKGSAYREAGIQIAFFKLTSVCQTHKPQIHADKGEPRDDATPAFKNEREAYFSKLGKYVSTPVFDYPRLRYGNIIKGPAIIEAPTTTIVVLPGQETTIDQYSNVVFEKF